MEQKKTQRASLDDKRLTGFLIGLVAALSLLLAALECTTSDGSGGGGGQMLDDVAQELELQAAPDRSDMIAAVEPHAKKANTQAVKVVDCKRSIENIAKIAQMRTVGEDGGSASGEGTGKADAANDDTEPLQPVAVDMGDNPLNFRVVEQLPEFPGGMSAFVRWLTDNLRYPIYAKRENIQGRVVVTFVVNRDGTVADIKIAQPVHPVLDREALRVARMMPRWKPGVANNRPCRTMMAIPIEFRI